MKLNPILIGWPDTELSPNARPHRMALWRAKNDAYRDGFNAAIERNERDELQGATDVRLIIAVYPPTKRKRDEDNIIASLKAYLDGIAYALGCDDHAFRIQPIVWKHVVTKGRIIIELESIA